MQECFEKKDIGMLQKLVAGMEKKDAEYHIKRCVDSGLWVPSNTDQPPVQTVEREVLVEKEETYEDAEDIESVD